MLDGARIFHVNVNCSDLARSREFYVDRIGLTEGVRTTPEAPQSGTAFGLDRAWWDAMILVGANGFEGGAIDLLQWLEPQPVGSPPTALTQTGFQRIGISVPDPTRSHDGSPRATFVRDPDGTTLELVEGEAARVAFVAVTCRDLVQSVAFYRALGFDEQDRATVAHPTGEGLGLDGPVEWVEVVLDAPGGGEVQLRLVGFERPVPVPTAAGAANALGVWRTALLLADLDGAVAALREAGIEPRSDPQSMSMGPGLPELRFVCFPGPDDEVIELIQLPT